MILHGLCPAALIRRPRFFCAIFIANLHGIATRTLSVSVFSFFWGFQNKKNRLVRRLRMYFQVLLSTMINLKVIFSDVYNIGMAHHRPCQEI